jgi:hypothetical protein
MENVTNRHFSTAISTFTDPNGNLVSAPIPQPARTYWVGVSIQFLN